MKNTNTSPAFLGVTFLSAAVLMVTMGSRQSMGLFVSPLNTATGLGIVSISFALAVSQFIWGAVQPIAGALADRYGYARMLAVGVFIAAVGNAITPLMTSTLGLTFAIGLVTAVGNGTGSFAVLMGATAQRVPAERRGIASGVVNAGGSFGQFVFAPLTQKLITLFGWMNAMWWLAAVMLAALPITAALRPRRGAAAGVPARTAAETPPPTPAFGGIRAQLRRAFGDSSYLLLHAAFFTCGFHIAFLVTHLPGEVHLCGLPAQVASWSLAIIGLANIAGSLLAGWSLQRFRGKYVLFCMYGARVLLIAAYLFAPKTTLTFYLFAAGLGFTWLATVPPTAGVIGKLFGTRYLATLFGLTMLSHQTGAFFGAWLGGIALTTFGDYQWMWYADMSLAAIAAVLNLPIREEHTMPALAPG